MLLHTCVFIRLGNEIGSGHFGVVSHGVWNHDGQAKQVAIKTLHGEVSEEAKTKLLKEAAIIGQFVHNNIVKLYGVITSRDPVSLDTSYVLMITCLLCTAVFIGDDFI